jgi:hypothetical protein
MRTRAAEMAIVWSWCLLSSDRRRELKHRAAQFVRCRPADKIRPSDWRGVSLLMSGVGASSRNAGAIVRT